MRLWISSLVFCCCAVASYAQQDSTDPVEVTTDVETQGDEGNVAVGTDSRGCGCRKPKI